MKYEIVKNINSNDFAKTLIKYKFQKLQNK